MDQERKLEEKILAFFERGEWQVAPNNQSEIKRFEAMASVALVTDERAKFKVDSH